MDFPYLTEHERFDFPDPESAPKEGCLGHGGNLSPGMLLSAYEQGIFPWFSDNEPPLWWSPDPRCVLIPKKVHISKSMRKVLKSGEFEVSFDTEFQAVISNCAEKKRDNQDGTWITSDMRDAYYKLFQLGFAHSLEVRKDGELAGGLYGLALGRMFFGESMFSHATNASKTAFIMLARFLDQHDFLLLDCQIPTPHLLSLGAEEMSRKEYLSWVKINNEYPGMYGSWTSMLQ